MTSRGLLISLMVTLAASAGGVLPLSASGAQPPGSLDSSFGGSGVVPLGSGSQLFGVAVQSNGEIVGVGQTGGSLLVTRYTTSGAPDGQYVGGAGTARAVAIQPDGAIVVAGTSGGAMFVQRLTSALTPDPSFGSGGTATALGGQSAVANSVALAPDGSIVAAGTVGTNNTSFGVADFAANGAVDWSESFAPLGLPYAAAEGVAVQPDGAIVLVGRDQGSPNYAYFNGLVVRLNSNGSYDSSFNGGAAVVSYHYPGGGYTSLNAVALQNNGDIVASGVDVGGPNAIFIRLNPSGSFDTSFGSDGVAALPAGENVTTNSGAPVGAYGVGIAGGGTIVGAGNFENTGTNIDAAAWALSAGGSAETTFGNGGVVTAPDNGYEACALAIAPDGSLVSVGNTVTSEPDANPCSVNGAAAGFVARYIGYGPPPPPATSPTTAAPTATTGSASAIGEVSAKLAGSIDPDGASTSYHFAYGTSTAYKASTASVTLTAGSSSVNVSAALTGLAPATTYHYRLVASNADGTSYGTDRTFTTAPKLTVKLSGLKRSYKISTVEKQGFEVSLRGSAACSIRGSLLISGASAKRFKLGKRQVTIGSGSASLRGAGTAKITFRLAKDDKSALAGLHKPLSVTLRIVSAPAGGGPTVSVTKTFTLND